MFPTIVDYNTFICRCQGDKKRAAPNNDAAPVTVYELLHSVDSTLKVGCCGNSVGFIGVDVHSSCKVLGNTTYNIAEDCLSAVGLDLYPNDLLILYAKLLSISGSKVDMTLCNDNTLGKLYLAAGANQLTCA